MRIGSSQAGGGQIMIEPEFDLATDAFYLPFANQVGGSSLYSDIFPSFAWILQAANGFHPLNEDVSITFSVEAPISDGAAVRVGGRRLSSPGASATLGGFENDPEAHVHPEWQLILPNGVTGEYQVSFRLSAEGFADSPTYTLLITNQELATTPSATPTAATTATEVPSSTTVPTATATAENTPTPQSPATATVEPSATASATTTATASPTHTAAPPACPGDCDGNGSVSIAELVRAVGLAGSGGTAGCAAVDGNGDGAVGINELIRAVRSALEGCATR